MKKCVECNLVIQDDSAPYCPRCGSNNFLVSNQNRNSGQNPNMQGQRSPMQGQGQRPPMQGQRPPMNNMQGQGQGQRPPMQGQRPPMQGQGQRPPMQGQGQRPPMNNMQGQGQRPPMQGQPQGGPGKRPPMGRNTRPQQAEVPEDDFMMGGDTFNATQTNSDEVVTVGEYIKFSLLMLIPIFNIYKFIVTVIGKPSIKKSLTNWCRASLIMGVIVSVLVFLLSFVLGGILMSSLM